MAAPEDVFWCSQVIRDFLDPHAHQDNELGHVKDPVVLA